MKPNRHIVEPEVSYYSTIHPPRRATCDRYGYTSTATTDLDETREVRIPEQTLRKCGSPAFTLQTILWREGFDLRRPIEHLTTIEGEHVFRQVVGEGLDRSGPYWEADNEYEIGEVEKRIRQKRRADREHRVIIGRRIQAVRPWIIGIGIVALVLYLIR